MILMTGHTTFYLKLFIEILNGRKSSLLCIRDGTPQVEDKRFCESEVMQVGVFNGYSKFTRIVQVLSSFPNSLRCYVIKHTSIFTQRPVWHMLKMDNIKKSTVKVKICSMLSSRPCNVFIYCIYSTLPIIMYEANQMLLTVFYYGL